MSDTLYHYCTLSTFMKIIESRTLRLPEIGKSNDYMELVWLKSRIIPEIIRQRFSEIIKQPFSELKSYIQNNKIILYTEFNWKDCDDLTTLNVI